MAKEKSTTIMCSYYLMARSYTRSRKPYRISVWVYPTSDRTTHCLHFFVDSLHRLNFLTLGFTFPFHVDFFLHLTSSNFVPELTMWITRWVSYKNSSRGHGFITGLLVGSRGHGFITGLLVGSRGHGFITGLLVGSRGHGFITGLLVGSMLLLFLVFRVVLQSN